MKMVWVPSLNRFRRTEGEVKKEKLDYEVLDIEIDKDSLIDRFNVYEEKLERASAMIPVGAQPVSEPDPAPVEEAPAPAPPAAVSNGKLPDESEAKRKMVALLQGMRTDEIEERIGESKGNDFGRYLCAAVCRLGELGQVGFEAFTRYRVFNGDPEQEIGKGRNKRFHLTAADERGLRYLALAQIDHLLADNEQPQAKAACLT